MTAARTASLLLLALLMTLPASAQRVGLGFSAGLHAPGAGSRYETTEGGWWHFESVTHAVLTPRLILTTGINWSVFDGEVPEFAGFEPLDHPAWLFQAQVFVGGRVLLAPSAARVRPYLAGRVGWAMDYAEYLGAEVRRSGPMVGAGPGLDLRLLGPLHLDASALVAWAALGAARVTDGLPTGPGSGARIVALRLGTTFWF